MHTEHACDHLNGEYLRPQCNRDSQLLGDLLLAVCPWKLFPTNTGLWTTDTTQPVPRKDSDATEREMEKGTLVAHSVHHLRSRATIAARKLSAFDHVKLYDDVVCSAFDCHDTVIFDTECLFDDVFRMYDETPLFLVVVSDDMTRVPSWILNRSAGIRWSILSHAFL
jgi:hypothetical protein